MKRTVALVAALVMGLGMPVGPAPAVPTSAAGTHIVVSVATAQVSYPKAVPGRFCKKVHRGDWTRTQKYGKVKCVDKNGWRWIRVR